MQIYNNIQSKVQTWEGNLDNRTGKVSVKRDLVSETGNKVSRTDLQMICPDLIDAYEEFNTGWDGGVQRDYLYYGMSKANTTNGKLNRFKRDLIYRLKISQDKLYSIMDSPKDPKKQLNTGRDDRPDFDGAISRMWATGNIELVLRFYQGTRNGEAGLIDEVYLSIYPGDLMYLAKCHDVFKWNIFKNNWSVYTIDKNEIQPKWFYPSDYGNFAYIHNEWNLADSSQNLWFKIMEEDDLTTIKTSESKNFKYSTSAKVDGGIEVIKGALGGSYESGTSSTFDITYTEGSDNLGSGYIEYIDSYITSSNSEGVYSLDYATTYSVDISLLPVDLRNKEKIVDYLSGRRERL